MDPVKNEPTSALAVLERLLAIEVNNLRDALDAATLAIAEALRADKVDVMLYHPEKETLIAAGTSDTAMGRRQVAIGLDLMPLANGGRAAQVFQSGQPFISGDLRGDPEELVGITEALGVRAEIIVPLAVDGNRRGVLLASSATPNFFEQADLRFLEAVARWVGLVVSRAGLVERIAEEAAARGRQTAAEELIAVLAHDLRNYLVPVRGRVDLIRRRALREGRQRDITDAEEVSRAVDRFSRLIADLLDVARLEQGIFTVTLQNVDLAALVRECAAATVLPEVPVNVQAPGELVILADAERVGQALVNVLSNAVQHSPPGSPVEVTVQAQLVEAGRRALITVRDRGPGIPPERLPTLFERFARGSNSSGLGLGLYLARRILEEHGGSIEAARNEFGGMDFRLTLPLAE